MGSRRVLWFINKVPLSVALAAGESSARGGWLDSYIELMGPIDGIDLTVAFPDWTRRTPTARIDGVDYVGLPTGEPDSRFGRVISRWRHDAAPAAVLAAAARLVQSVEPDLVHVHGADGPYGLAIRGCGVPAVLSIQGSPTAFGHAYRRGIDRYLLRSLSFGEFLRGSGLVHQALTVKSRAATEVAAMASVGHVAGRTEWDHDLASAMAPQALYHHCDEPMRLPFHEASWNAADADPDRIVSVTGEYALKGVGTLLRAVAVLRRARPGIALDLIGIVPGSEHERAARRHVRALGMEDVVTFTGEVDAPTLVAALCRASVFVNPSHMENGSNSLSEAQLVGVPCVASRVGGMVTTADHGSAALLVPDGNPDALAGAALSLLDDPAGAGRLGARGRALATVRHDPARIREQVLTIYDVMLA